MTGGRQLQRVAKPARQASYDAEVRRLIRATETVMFEKGPTEQPRVADIVRAAGVSNQAFYRHFRSRDDVVLATYEQGLLAVHEYLAHQVFKHTDFESRIRAWINGMLRQIEDPDLSELTAVIFWNVNQIARHNSEIEPVGRARMLHLLSRIYIEAGAPEPARTALFVQTLVVGITSRFCEVGERPSDEEREALIRFCLRGSELPDLQGAESSR